MDRPHQRTVVPEHARFCLACGGPVGRGRDGRPGRERGVCPWCRSPFDLTPALAPGEPVEGARGRYRVREAWRPGSRGWLYLADPEPAGRRPAVAEEVGEPPVVLTRIEGPEGVAAGDLAVREPEVLVDLEVPGLVPARDVAVAAGPSRHLVLEYVPGHRLDTVRPQPALVALDAVLAVTAPLGVLHARGLLHSDVTPANLLGGGPGVTLMDLGSVRRATDRVTDVWGTTGFLAPEIAPGGRGPSVASEVYALGRTLAVLLLDFDHAISHEMRLPEGAPLLDEHPELARLLARATDPEPERRHRGVDAFADHARAVRAGLVAGGHDVLDVVTLPTQRHDRDGVGGGAASP